MTEILEKYNITMKIDSPLTTIYLPEQVDDVQYIKVRYATYITVTSGNRLMQIALSGLNPRSYYFNGSTHQQYLRTLPLLPNLNAFNNYFNSQLNLYDVKLPSKQTIFKLDFSIMIDGALATDISPSNPLYLELSFF